MRNTILGIPVERDKSPGSSSNSPNSISVFVPHHTGGYQEGGRSSRMQYVTVVGYDSSALPNIAYQIPHLPTPLGRAATYLMTESAVLVTVLRT